MDEIKRASRPKRQQTAQISEDELATCRHILQMLSDSPELCLMPDSPFASIAQKAALLGRRMKSARKQESRSRDRAFVEKSGIRNKRKSKSDGRYQVTDETAHTKETNIVLSHQRRCYVCKKIYQKLHSFYDLMCIPCGQQNFLKRSQTADLSNRTAVVTGGRVKIGFQIALKLLRSGARVLVTSRFPCDAAKRYAAEDDFANWGERLQIFSADFRSLVSVNQLCNDIRANCAHLDVLINNASQTIRRPAAFYHHLLEEESRQADLPQEVNRLIFRQHNSSIENQKPVINSGHIVPPDLSLSAALSQAPVLAEDTGYDLQAFPPGLLDDDSQQIDRRRENSWIQDVADVQIPELLEVHAVNSLVPFILIQQMEPLLLQSPMKDRYIVNVSAMEGQLNTHYKTGFHPHTNMAKAGINMVTRTSGPRFAQRGIYMTSVDTGWVTNEFPHQKTEEMKQSGFQPPLDEIDGAARVCDPIFTGINEKCYMYGKFLKDYKETNW